MNIHVSPRSLSTTVVGVPSLPAHSLVRIAGKTLRIGSASNDPDGSIELMDGTTYVDVRDHVTGERMKPTLDWMREGYRRGIVASVGTPENASERQGRFALLDPDACVDRDPKVRWRLTLASRALAADIKLTDRECKAWLDAEYGREEQDLLFRKPSPSALRRWMSKLKKSGRRMDVLVSAAGRRRGQSQLSPEANAFAHECALYYWTRPKLQKVDAYALLSDKVTKHNAVVPPDAAIALPSKQTLYKRIDRLRCFETVAAKCGTKEAVRQFEGSGEGLIVNNLLEVVLMDATTLEQTIVFDGDWSLPACKVRVVALMDALTHGIIGCHVYAGPNRGEASIEAVLIAMQPPSVDPEALAEMPILAWMYGRGRALLPDNEKGLVGPSTIDAFNEVGIDVLMPPIEMPTAKATLERWFRTLKQAIAQLPGTLIDPKRAKEMGYDPIGPCLTLE